MNDRVVLEKQFKMKTSILFFLAFFYINFSLQAQTVNGIPLKDIEEEYLQIIPKDIKATSREVQLLIDFGQETKRLRDTEQLLLDSAGNKMVFNSEIEALNFLYKNGYELIEVYRTDSFMMRKRKKY